MLAFPANATAKPDGGATTAARWTIRCTNVCPVVPSMALTIWTAESAFVTNTGPAPIALNVSAPLDRVTEFAKYTFR